MYTPRSFADTENDVLYAFIDANPFGALITASHGLFATHLPLVLRRDSGPLGTLEGHVARANEHHERVASATEALVIFSGPHAHVTPSWYPSKLEGGKVVPTWNYVAVHIYGTVRFIDDPEFLRAHLARLTARHESERGSEWTTNDPPADYMTQQLRAIVGVEIAITRIEGKWKMSQNRVEVDVDGVVKGLRDSGSAEDAAVADIVLSRRR